jgi:hypothetical protein
MTAAAQAAQVAFQIGTGKTDLPSAAAAAQAAILGPAVMEQIFQDLLAVARGAAAAAAAAVEDILVVA